VWFLFVDSYVAAFGAAHQTAAMTALLPNLTFTLAVLLYAIFRYLPPAPELRGDTPTR
jgi:hypothetical protein